MSVRVRYAPSPTGLQHIGGARTALFCDLFARAHGGVFVLRVEDTDEERSKREYEDLICQDLKWLGLHFAEGPDMGGELGPYRQSERKELYKELAEQLVNKGLAYPCFASTEELEVLTQKAVDEKKAPHAYHGVFRDLDPNEAAERIKNGDDYVIRFKNPQKEYKFKDIVRGEVTFGPDMVGDFVLMRTGGMPVYNFCCVIDDWKMKISHVIRAEEHLNNTLRQLMLYEAFDAEAPQFAHCSLLVGEDRQKLSKRHGATSVSQYQQEGFLPHALVNYLCLLGWSHPEEKDVFDAFKLGEQFDLKRLVKSPALYDIEKLKYINGQHLRALSDDELYEHARLAFSENDLFQEQGGEWQKKFFVAFKEKVNLSAEYQSLFEDLFLTAPKSDDTEYSEIMSWETTETIKNFVSGELSKTDQDYLSPDIIGGWMDTLKKEHKIKGKNLFKGFRAVTTCQSSGMDLKILLGLTPVSVLKKRL